MNDWLSCFQIIFLSLFLQGLPFLLAGAFLGSFVTAFVPVRSLMARLPQTGLPGILAGAVAGLAIPSCECVGALVVRRLLRHGLPPGTAMAYLLASPVLNPVCLASTWAAFQFDHPLTAVLTRAGGSAFIAIGVALIFSRLPAAAVFRPGLAAGDGPAPAAGWWNHPPAAWLARRYPRLAAAVGGGFADFFSVMLYYLSGCLIAAGAQTALPPEAIPSGHPALAVPAFMGLSVVTSLCSSADAFVAKSFAGCPLAALFAFLWLGAVFDLKLLFVYQSIFQRKAVLLLALLLITLVAALALAAAQLPLERIFYGPVASA